MSAVYVLRTGGKEKGGLNAGRSLKWLVGLTSARKLCGKKQGNLLHLHHLIKPCLLAGSQPWPPDLAYSS